MSEILFVLQNSERDSQVIESTDNNILANENPAILMKKLIAD
jgi:hypothetical protein